MIPSTKEQLRAKLVEVIKDRSVDDAADNLAAMLWPLLMAVRKIVHWHGMRNSVLTNKRQKEIHYVLSSFCVFHVCGEDGDRQEHQCLTVSMLEMLSRTAGSIGTFKPTEPTLPVPSEGSNHD